MLRKDTKLARKHGNMFEFITFLLLEFLRKEKDDSLVHKEKKSNSPDASPMIYFVLFLSLRFTDLRENVLPVQ